MARMLSRSETAEDLGRAACASRCSAHAAFRPTTAASKLSPKSFPRAWRRAATRSRSTAASAHPGPTIAAYACSTCPPSATSTSTPSRTPSSRTLHLLVHRADVALYCNGANAIFTPWPRAASACRWRSTWTASSASARSGTALARAWYLVSEWLSTFCPTAVVTDAQAIQHYYRERYRKASTFIPYGAPAGKVETARRARRPGPGTGRYFLYVSRMEPENHALEVRAGVRTGGDAAAPGAGRRRPLRRRIHPPRARHARPAHRDSRAPFTARATTSCSRTASPTSTPPRSAARTRR